MKEGCVMALFLLLTQLTFLCNPRPPSREWDHLQSTAPPHTSNINQENVLPPHLQPSLMGHLSGEVPSFLMTQLVSSTVMCFQAILLSWRHPRGKENTGKEEEIYSRRAETLLLFGLALKVAVRYWGCPWLPGHYRSCRVPFWPMEFWQNDT